MNQQLMKKLWEGLTHRVTDLMKVHTRPFVPGLAGTKIGTGTFIEREGIKIVTCAHVANCQPDAFYIDASGCTHLRPGIWCMDTDDAVDAALAPVPADEWNKVASRAQPLAMSRFAQRHNPVAGELLFFRGLAGENVTYISPFGADLVVSGYCSQERQGTGDAEIFEMLWVPGAATVTNGTAEENRGRIKYDDPAGFSGSLVWNTRFVERGCDLTNWDPDDAVVTGMLRRYDAASGTLLAWRIEHLLAWF